MIWLVGWGKIIVLHVRHALSHNSLTWFVKLQREISKFKVLMTTWTHNSKYFVLYLILRRSYPSTCSVICQQYRTRAKSNNRKVVTIVQRFIFEWRFICRSRRGCLSSLLPWQCISLVCKRMLVLWDPEGKRRKHSTENYTRTYFSKPIPLILTIFYISSGTTRTDIEGKRDYYSRDWEMSRCWK